MFMKDIPVRLYEKGDRVLTPAGKGVVYETESVKSEDEYNSRLVVVQLDHHPGGQTTHIMGDVIALIDEPIPVQ